MMTFRTFARASLLVAFLASPFACSTTDEANCASICEEAQEKNCTIIKGDCDAVCSSAFALDDASQCASQRETWQDCLNEQSDVCAGTCDSEENAYSNCIGSHCLLNMADPDCQVLAGAL